MTTVVISDIHSRKRKLVALLQRIGAMDSMGKRVDGYHLIQLGDAVSAGYGMEESGFYDWWTDFLIDSDEELVGNHEAPVLWPYDDRFKFYGYEPGDMGQSGCEPALKHLILTRQDRYKMATTVGSWLISHAGIYPKHDWGDSARDHADRLNELWREHIHAYDPHPWMGCVICDNEDGVMWGRGLHERYEGHLNQIIGHTPIGPLESDCGKVKLIDTPRLAPVHVTGRGNVEAWGGVAALVTTDEGKTWELEYVK